MVAIPKPGADPSSPDNVRGIAIQSYMRKLYTLLLTQRVYAYANAQGTLPPYQNGFRPGHRTADNVFILRALHEAALRKKQQLYIAQIDIRKAFDSVSRPDLFKRLYEEGIHGPLIEVLRQSYIEQEVYLKANRRYSDMIHADTGVLQGDPISPLLFIIYVAHLKLDHEDDPTLAQNPIPYVALADDFTLTATTIKGLQHKINRLALQCASLKLFLNPSKCAIFALGTMACSPYIPLISLHGIVIPRRFKVTINGYPLCSSQLAKGWDANTAALAYNLRAVSAHRTIVLQRDEIGLTTPLQFRTLHKSLVECQHLYAQESHFDTDAPTSKIILLTQKSQLRAMAGVHATAITAILYRDFLLLTTNHQAILSAARYLQYLLTLPDQRPAKWALYESERIPNGWYARIRHELGLLQVPLTPHDSLAVRTTDALWMKQHLELQLCLSWSRMEVWQLVPQQILLHHQPPAPANYLKFPRRVARQCARLRTSSHLLAIEYYRIGNRRRERALRHCPHCPGVVETELHTLVLCPNTAPIRARFGIAPLDIMTRSLLVPDLKDAEFVAAILSHVDKRYAH